LLRLRVWWWLRLCGSGLLWLRRTSLLWLFRTSASLLRLCGSGLLWLLRSGPDLLWLGSRCRSGRFQSASSGCPGCPGT
jgi:hypothetical protein